MKFFVIVVVCYFSLIYAYKFPFSKNWFSSKRTTGFNGPPTQNGSDIMHPNDGKGAGTIKFTERNVTEAVNFKSYRSDGLTFIQKWWDNNTKGRSGLLLLLVPIFIGQLRLVCAAIPFVIDRSIQYINPFSLATLFVTLQPKGLAYLQISLLTSMGLGIVAMMKDSYFTASSWLPIFPRQDSYAIVTGASSGLGREISRQLYLHGFNLVLISSNSTMLEEVKKTFISHTFDDISDAAIVKKSSIEVPRLHPASNDTLRLAVQSESKDAPVITSIVHHNTPKKYGDIKTISCDLTSHMSSFYILNQLKRFGVQNKVSCVNSI